MPKGQGHMSLEEIQKQEEDCGPCDAMSALASMRQMRKAAATTSAVAATPKKDTAPATPSDDGFWEMRPPPDTIDLGNSGWTLLHTMSAYYPDQPTPTKKQEMSQFLEAFSKVYPCNVCAEDFQQIMKRKPPTLDNRKSFSNWMCWAHNEVNRQLGKPDFNCQLIDERWRAPETNYTHAQIKTMKK
ncbi:hypothetical protein PROFUN_09415 [Planoprotostelium fungivorum]|uniref:Sulfhydryl oxidase n=1 Tax=Planoprotostelium fungivorum TaxID=1890364 RepID=A0A2P6NHG6_9EUKA|nr:hypothetical protein PROFUN_09415 [Planoprotostelium fungivorum]